jgi:hypothetical protein
MPVDRRIARRFVKADQEPMAESLHLAVDRSGCGWVPVTVDILAAAVVNCGIYALWVCPRRTYFLLILTSEPEFLFISEGKILRCGGAVAARST